MGDEPFDLNALRVNIDQARQLKSAKPKKWRRHYVRVPWTWVERLKSTRRIAAYRLAHLLLYERWRTGGQPIAMSNVLLRGEGISPRSKSNALVELQKLGLIKVERRFGKAPRVVLCCVSGRSI